MAHGESVQEDTSGGAFVSLFERAERMKYDYIIAIDPDVDKSGVATLDVRNKNFAGLGLTNLSFPDLIHYVAEFKRKYENTPFIVIVEAGWMAQGNWHLSFKETKQRAASKGYDVGRNHETGHKIVECLKHFGVEVLEHYPLRKCWKGKDGKITHEELAYFTGISGRTNQDARDAALLAWNFAKLPIRVKC